jgi:DNA-directed RNA polymerase subunit beta'
VGEAVGVVAAQSIGEPGTQLTMRTFHIGGTVTRGAETSSIDATHDGEILLLNRNLVEDSQGRLVVMSRNCELLIVDSNKQERARFRIPYGSKLTVDQGHAVTRGMRLADWDPYTIPIVTERSGIVAFRDLVDSVSMQEVTDEATGISSKQVVDVKQQRSLDLRPRLILLDEQGKQMILSNGLEARYFLPVNSILGVEDGQFVHAGDVIARIPRESTQNRDITGGLPRVAELFEARRPKDHSIISEVEGLVHFGKDYKSKRRIIITPPEGPDHAVEYLVPRGKHISVNEGDYVRRGDLLMDGNPVPHDILKVMGVAALTHYMVSEIQQVYRLQGVRIDDKHIEVILRQMLQKVEVTHSGDTTLLVGEQIDRDELFTINQKALAQGYAPAVALPILQGDDASPYRSSSDGQT